MKKRNSQLKSKAKKIARKATKAIKRELDYALRDHKLSKKELAHVGKAIKKEAKHEGRRIGDFLKGEFRREFAKAVPIIESYLKQGKKAIVKKSRVKKKK